MKVSKYLPHLKSITKGSTPGERVIGSLFPNRGSSWYAWGDDRIRQVSHMKNWTYVAIHTICSKMASIVPNMAYVSNAAKPGLTTKACNRSAGQFGGESFISDGGHSYLTMGAYRNKALSVIKPHEELEPLESEHPLRRLLENPNPVDTSFDLLYETQMFQELCGVSYTWAVPSDLGKRTGSNIPCELWCIPSHWCWPRTGGGQILDPTYEFSESLIAYYEIRPWGGAGAAGMLKIPPDEIIMERWKSPVNKFDGYSKLTAIAQWIDSEESISASRWSQFINQARPEFWVELGEGYEDPNDDRISRLEAKFAAKIQGEYNYGKPVITPPGAKITPLSFSPTEMAYFQSEEQIRDMILSAFQVPKSAVGISEGMTYGSVLATLAQLCENCINPRLAMRGQALSKQLASRWSTEGRRIKIWWDNCTPADPAQVNSDITTDLQADAITPNEVRALRGRKPYRNGGDDPMGQGPGGKQPIPLNTGEDLSDLASLIKPMTEQGGEQPGAGGAMSGMGNEGKPPLALPDESEQPRDELPDDDEEEVKNPLEPAEIEEPNSKPNKQLEVGNDSYWILSKGKGTCKPGQTAATTGCTPASGESRPKDNLAEDKPKSVSNVNPRSLNKDNVTGLWESIRDEIIASDPKISENQAGSLAAARILNASRKDRSDFLNKIDSKVRNDEPITDEEDVEYSELQDGDGGLRNKLVSLSGYRPHQLLDEHPEALKPLSTSSEPSKQSTPKVGEIFTIPDTAPNEQGQKLKIDSIKDGKINFGYAGDTHARSSMPESTWKHLVNDLQGKVDVPPGNDPYIEDVREGKAKFLGKGQDGLAFQVGDAVVKVSTPVPLIVTNPMYQTPEAAVERMRIQSEVSEQARKEGVPGILPIKFVEQGDKGFQIRPYVEIPDKLTPEQLKEVSDNLQAMHNKGYTLGDDIQVGLYKGKPVFFDTGAMEKKPEDRIKSSADHDIIRLERLYEDNDQEYVPPPRNKPMSARDRMNKPKKTMSSFSQEDAWIVQKKAGPHKFSSTQIDIPELTKLTKWTKEMIPKVDLASDGYEDEPHVTVKYGLHTQDAEEVKKLVQGFGPIKLKLGNTSIFYANEAMAQRGGEQYDVVKIDVDSPDLVRLNKLVGKLEHTDTHPNYQPHLTLAYVREGFGENYDGVSIPDGIPTEFTIDKITYSDKEGKHTEISLLPVTKTKPRTKRKGK